MELETLEKHDVIFVSQNNKYAYTVELMRRWVAGEFPTPNHK
jgi:hypothetical protein